MFYPLGHPCCKWQHFILFYGQIIFHHTYMSYFFIHLSVDKHLGCFHVLAIINNAAVNIRVHVSFQINVFFFYFLFFSYIPRRGVARSHGSSVFSFLEMSILLHQFIFPPTVYKGSLFSISPEA